MNSMAIEFDIFLSFLFYEQIQFETEKEYPTIHSLLTLLCVPEVIFLQAAEFSG